MKFIKSKKFKNILLIVAAAFCIAVIALTVVRNNISTDVEDEAVTEETVAFEESLEDFEI